MLHTLTVVPDESIFVPLIIGRDLLNKANIELVSVKRRYTKHWLLSFNNHSETRYELDFLGILRPSDNFECRSDILTKKSHCDSNLTKANNTPQQVIENHTNYFDALCAIDTTSNADELFNVDNLLTSDQFNSFQSAIYEAYVNTEVNPLCSDDYCMKIETTSTIPIYRRPRRLSYQERIEDREIIDDLLSRNIIRPSNPPYASTIVPTRKKSGEMRKCVDYRPLNKITLREVFGTPG